VECNSRLYLDVSGGSYLDLYARNKGNPMVVARVQVCLERDLAEIESNLRLTSFH
jgi:hypothetical protein